MKIDKPGEIGLCDGLPLSYADLLCKSKTQAPHILTLRIQIAPCRKYMTKSMYIHIYIYLYLYIYIHTCAYRLRAKCGYSLYAGVHRVDMRHRVPAPVPNNQNNHLPYQ